MLAPCAADIRPLLADVGALPGVGGKTRGVLARLLGREEPRVIDLLLHVPARVIQRRSCLRLSEFEEDAAVIVSGRVHQHRPPQTGTNQPYSVTLGLGGGSETVEVIHWGKGRSAFSKAVPVGSWRRISGKVKSHNGRWRLYPDHPAEDLNARSAIPLLEPVYPLTKGISISGIRKLIAAALARVPEGLEWHDLGFLQKHGWPSFGVALRAVHRPEKGRDADSDGPARMRLAFDELLARQIPLARAAERMKTRHKQPIVGNASKSLSIELDFGFPLTPSQAKALDEIRADMAKPHATVRLVQGDVGSGKTLVALLAAATVAEAGRQAALLAPTELLARQHFETIEPLARGAGMRIGLLTGNTSAAERRRLVTGLLAGEIDLLVGTHALLEPEVTFKNLALAIIDEQHRFGRDQRLGLVKKGRAIDGLLLSATPIPQTMALALHGAMPVSELREKPAGRKPVITTCTPAAKLGGVVQAVGRALEKGQRVFWVTPLVEQSSKSELATATARFEELRARFGDQVALAHGRMKVVDKDAAMDRFASGAARLLVATTVIEVGLDVPEANVMVIEHAQRYGLSQLHQLRGRVGRGSEQAYCVLVHDTAPEDEPARARLDALRGTNDGFEIAEEDLRLRGAGDLFGARQSGEATLRTVEATAHTPLFKVAREAAGVIADFHIAHTAWTTLFASGRL